VLQITKLRADFGPALVLGAHLIADRQAVIVALAGATKLARTADIAHHAAITALKRLPSADLIFGDALAIFGVPFEVADAFAGRSDQRGARIAGGAARIGRAIGRAVGVRIIGSSADTHEAVRRVALGARGAMSVELARLLRVSEIAKVTGDTVCIRRALAFAQAEAIEV